MNNILSFIIISALILICVSCGLKKDIEHQGENIPGVETRISRILINKYAFEKAIVKIKGKAKNTKIYESQGILKFRLVDKKGNFVNVISNKLVEIKEDDYLILSGVYNSAENLVVLEEFEVSPI